MNGLLGTTSAEQYYTKSQQFTTTSTQASNGEYTLTVSNLPASEADFMVFVNGTEINPSTYTCLLYTSPSPRDVEESRMPSSA